MASISGRRGHDNQRRRIGLKTTDKEQAGALALEFYLKLRALGWEQALRWWKRGDSTPTKKSNVTIGEYLDAVREKSQIHPKTLESFSAALRKIASDIARLDSNSKRSAWREQVDAIKLASLTTEEIEEWRASFIKRGSTNPLAEKSAKVSANSFIGRARSLFSADVIARVKDIVEIPSPAPFAGVKVERVRATRYRSTFDIATLLESTRTELATDRTELFKILSLASMIGLRRHEIDLLPWTSFRWDEALRHADIKTTFNHYVENKQRSVLGFSHVLKRVSVIDTTLS